MTTKKAKKKVAKKVARHSWEQQHRGAKCKKCGLLLRASPGKKGGCNVYFVRRGATDKIFSSVTPPCVPVAESA